PPLLPLQNRWHTCTPVPICSLVLDGRSVAIPDWPSSPCSRRNRFVRPIPVCRSMSLLPSRPVSRFGCLVYTAQRERMGRLCFLNDRPLASLRLKQPASLAYTAETILE